MTYPEVLEILECPFGDSLVYLVRISELRNPRVLEGIKCSYAFIGVKRQELGHKVLGFGADIRPFWLI